MYILFGTKWAKLFNGPLLSHAPIMQSSQEATDESSNPYHPTKVNIVQSNVMTMSVLLLGSCQCGSYI